MAANKKTPIAPTPTCYDLVGREIKPGVIIAYGHAIGRSAGLRIGKVIDVLAYAAMRYEYVTPYVYGQPTPNRVLIEDTKNPDWRVTVQGFNTGWNANQTATPLARLSTLMYPARMVVIGENTTDLPDRAESLIDAIAEV